jgi:competence protein ComEA
VKDEQQGTLRGKPKKQRGKQHDKPNRKEGKTMRRTLVTLALLASLALPAWAQEKQGVVNVNTASVQELQLLPRVGPALAKRIVEFREKNGPFKSTQELMRVSGIGEKTFALLSPYVSTSGATTLKEKIRAGSSRRQAQGQKAAGGN